MALLTDPITDYRALSKALLQLHADNAERYRDCATQVRTLVDWINAGEKNP